MSKRWMFVTLLNMLIAVSIGALLRFAFVEEVIWLDFKNFLHAHSHVAILGWVYLALYSFLITSFLPNAKDEPKYNILFWATQASVVGMLITFPVTGYGLWSISFSTLHILLSYLFVFFFLRDLKKYAIQDSYSLKLVKAGLLFMVVSTLALWAMGPIMAMELQGEAIYFISIQFYLHFQFNGWFIFTILGLLFKLAEDRNIEISAKQGKWFFNLLFISCLMTFALAVTWSNPKPILFWINSIGVSVQMAALVVLTQMVIKLWPKLKKGISKGASLLLQFSFYCLFLKIFIQTAVVIPYLGTVAYTIRNYVIGYLHLMLIGVVSLFILGFAQQKKLLSIHVGLGRLGVWVFLLGFLLSEAILFIQGTMFWGNLGFLPYYYEVLFGVSVLLPVGILMVVFGQLNTSPQITAQ